MTDLSPLLERAERAVSRIPLPAGGVERLRSRRARRRRNQRIAAGIVAIAIFAAPVALFARLNLSDDTRAPASAGIGSSSAVPGTAQVDDSAPVPEALDVDYVIDLTTKTVTPLPQTILRSVVRLTPLWTPRYAVSSDGRLAFVGMDDDGNPQIFVAHLDGTDVRQVTHDQTAPTSPAWSPDATQIVYEGNGSGGRHAVFVLDVANGVTTQVVDGITPGVYPTFTPDGTSILYTGGSPSEPVLRTVPVAGGESTLAIGPGEGITDAGNGSISPDGSSVTFLGSGEPEPGGHCGPCRFVANADGTGRRVIPGWMAVPAGIWSPDGTRIVTSAGERLPKIIVVVDVATGSGTKVANGRAAIWINDHTLLVEAA
jgi:hypothetical protein